MKTKIRLKRKILKNLGVRVKYFRNLKGISQETLAFQVGVDRTYIGAIEQGTRSPSVYCLFVIANALDISLNELMNITVE
ncbi:MAG: helix-turn-helix transcriptional regulator [Candidatus Gastranaerophilales bacterium]|nr:helix-turn-helix transcriptional regulator [Candidatus Gastranaerophilales bacterium]